MFDWLGPAAGIVLVDLILSGDNAVVIGAAAAGLPASRRWWAILLGGGGAVVLRILFALAATLLLGVDYLGVVGGVILLFIAVRLLLDRSKEWRQKQSEQAGPDPTPAASNQSLPPTKTQSRTAIAQRSFLGAIFTILIADVTMSLDNILAVAGLARETPLLLVGGLLLSIAILLLGSALVASLINRFPLLLDVACLVVAWTAAHLFLSDDAVGPLLAQYPWIEPLSIAGAFLIVLACDLVLYLRRN